MGVFKNIVGKKFNYLTVLKLLDKTDRGFWWLCRCDCGKEVRVLGSNIIRGHNKSCGCYKIKINSEIHRKHYMIDTRIYKTWSGMKNRCLNPKNQAYKDYGERGITVCDKWLDFQGFYEDMKDNYSDNLTIDRIDNNKGYFKSNCRWATKLEQANNVRDNHIITVDNVTDTVANICRLHHVNYNRVIDRISHGWDASRAIKEPKSNIWGKEA